MFNAVGIIGVGPVGRALAAHTARADLPVLISSSRGPDAGFNEFLTTLGFAPVYVGTLHEGGRMMQLGGALSAVHVLRQD